MENLFDEFSKSLAEPVFGVPVFGRPVSRRETLRRLGAVFAGAVLAPLGLATAAWAHGPDPCRAFCQCRTKAQQSQCLAACRACNSDPSHVCGTCGNYYCSDLSSDPNCGACGHDCELIGWRCRLQRDVHIPGLGSRQLRRLRERLPRYGAVLQREWGVL